MARTLYDEAELLVLDDVFSALDVKTSSTIRSRLFEGDLLKSGNTTVIMTTSMRKTTHPSSFES